MIYRKKWSKGYGVDRCTYDGWFLFGFIPLFISKS